MDSICIFNETEEEIDELEELERVLKYATEKEKLGTVYFNVIIVNNDYIHELNKNYRNIDRETDVITFALEDEDLVKNESGMRVLGDIYISLDRAKEQAKEYGHSFKRELIFLAVHGFYHLLGYDHITKEDEEIMFARQEEVLSECGIKRENSQ